MSREVVVTRWCDAWRLGGARTEATECFTLGIGTEAAPGSVRVLDLCQPCRNGVLGPVLVLWSKCPEWKAPDRKGPGRPPKATQSHAEPVVGTVTPGAPSGPGAAVSGPPWACPVCGKVQASKASLVGHVWRRHVGMPRPIQPLVCPDCGQEFRYATGTGIHRTRHHSYDNLREALDAIPA